jgi:uncharacterized protein
MAQPLDVTRCLNLAVEYLKGTVVEKAWVFGSQARGDAGPDSDLDLLIQPHPNSKCSLFDLGLYEMELSERLNCRIHLLTPGDIPARSWPAIERERRLFYDSAA